MSLLNKCNQSKDGKHHYVPHTSLGERIDVGLIDGTYMCEYCKKEITQTQYQNLLTNDKIIKVATITAIATSVTAIVTIITLLI